MYLSWDCIQWAKFNLFSVAEEHVSLEIIIGTQCSLAAFAVTQRRQ